MPNYQTKQRRRLLDFFSCQPNEAFSAKQIVTALEDISASAVYRNLALLEAQGLVRRATKAGSHEAFFQLAQGDHRLHLSCEKCGRVYPVEGEGAARLLQSIVPAQHFAVDPASTVLYGICGACQEDAV